MGINWVKTGWFLRTLFRKYYWRIPKTEKTVYLTFDDGPIPEITPWVLDLLRQNTIKATFFCIGDNIQKNPEIAQQIIQDGHTLGNHTFNHLNGWKNSTTTYLQNTKLGAQIIAQKTGINPTLFRPPYGKIKPSQAKKLIKQGYKIIMWDIISYDFDDRISSEKCLHNVIDNIENGSIIVFHDSIKARKHLEYVLPRVIEYLKKEAFLCESLH